jgi:hypothetical protein
MSDFMMDAASPVSPLAARRNRPEERHQLVYQLLTAWAAGCDSVAEFRSARDMEHADQPAGGSFGVNLRKAPDAIRRRMNPRRFDRTPRSRGRKQIAQLVPLRLL